MFSWKDSIFYLSFPLYFCPVKINYLTTWKCIISDLFILNLIYSIMKNLFVLLSCICCFSCKPSIQQIDLSGTWEFTTDTSQWNHCRFVFFLCRQICRIPYNRKFQSSFLVATWKIFPGRSLVQKNGRNTTKLG